MPQATLPALTKEKKARLVMGVISVQDKEPGCDRRVQKGRVTRIGDAESSWRLYQGLSGHFFSGYTRRKRACYILLCRCLDSFRADINNGSPNQCQKEDMMSTMMAH